MTAWGILFLIGLFVLPLALLRLGHRLRGRTPVQRGAFWGGTWGYGAGTLLMIAAMHYPPVLWDGMRTPLVYGSLALGTVVGAAVGALLAGRRADGATGAG